MRRRVPITLYAYEKRTFTLALGFFLISASAYMYFVCFSVMHVIMRTETDQQIAALNTTISDLENRYIEAKEAITYDKAIEHGFSRESEKVFITRTPANLVLGVNDES